MEVKHMLRPVEVRVLDNHCLWLRYDDGVEGTVDLSDLVGRGVFAAWTDRHVFEAVQITDSGALEWPDGIDLCADALYLRVTGKTPEEIFSKLKTTHADA